MKRHLLFISKNVPYLNSFKSLRLLVVLYVFFGFVTDVQGQCPSYQIFESFKTFGITGTPTTTFSTPGYMNGYNQGVVGTDYWRTFSTGGVIAVGNAYTGRAALRLNTYVTSTNYSYFITPSIKSPGGGTSTLSFYYKQISAGLASDLVVEYSSNYTGGGADPNAVGVVWTQLGSTISVASTTYVATPAYTFSPGASGYYIRVRRASTGATPVIDDFAISSSIASENTQVVLPTQTASGPTVTCTTVPMPVNGSYIFSDNGGLSDNYDNAVAQDHTVIFTPAPGQRIRLSFATGTATFPLNQVPGNSAYSVFTTPTGSITISDTDNTITNYTTNSAPATIYTSTASGCTGTATVRFVTSAGTTGTGFVLNVSSVAPASCANISGLGITSASVTSSSVPLTWTGLSGCVAPSGGYDYYVSTSATAPLSGTTPTGNEPNPASTGTLVSSLLSSTTYYGWVRTNCGIGSYGTWTAIPGATFTTLCAPVSTPYLENFTGMTGAQINTAATCVGTNSISYGISSPAGNDCFFNTTTLSHFFTKPLTLDPTKIYRLSFDYASSSNQTTVIEAFYGKSDYAVIPAVTNSSLGIVSTNKSVFATSRSYFRPSTASTYYIGIKINGIVGGALLLDNIKVEEVPCWPAARPSAISGTVSSCPAATVVYTATAGSAFAGNSTVNGVANASSASTGFTWSVPTGWLLTGGQGTAVATVTTGIIPGNVSATGDLAGCDSSMPRNYAVTSSPIPAQPSVISGLNSFCVLPNNGLVYSVTNVATSYVWSFPAGWTVTAGAFTNSVTVNATAGAVSGLVTVTPYNGASGTGCAGLPRTLAVSVGSVTNNTFATAAPIVTTATDSFRCSLRHFWYAYTVPAGCGGVFKINLGGNGGDIDLYVYPSSPNVVNSFPATAAGTIPGGSSLTASATESVTVSLTAGSTYHILVYAYTSVVDGGGTFNLSVSSQSIGTPGPIAGTGSVSCSSITSATYSIAAVSGATSYTWTVPPGWNIVSGVGTTSIDITTNGTSAGTVSVIATGACGISIPATKIITVGQVQPDAITGAPQLCSPFTATTYSIDPVDGATSYVWTLPAGWVGSSVTTSITVTPSATSGSIKVSAVGPCGTSPATSFDVVTASAVTTTDALLCIGGSGSLTSVINPVTTFTMSDVPTTGAPTFVRSYAGTTYSASFNTVPYTRTTISTLSTGAGDYTFNGCGTGDTFLHIYDTTFDPAAPATNFLAANDDGNGTSCTLDPRITITLLANHSYVLVYSTYSSTTSGITGITINVTPPGGVAGIQFGTTDWYTTASGGSPIYTGNTFNPVGVAGSGLLDTNTAATTVFFATNSLSSYCRKATNFTINEVTAALSVSSMNVCPNSLTPITVAGTGNTYTWTSSVGGTLFSDAAGTAYVPLTNLTTVYVRNTAVNTITVTGTIIATGCTVTRNVVLTPGANTTTWNGVAWSPINVAPTINDAIVLAGNWSGGSLTGCSCQVNPSVVVTFAGTDSLTLVNQLNVATINPPTVTFENNSSLFQYNNSLNSGRITYQRTTTPVLRFDYTYWSTPVTPQTVQGFTPFSPLAFEFDSAGINNWVSFPLTTNMVEGKGYIVRAPSYIQAIDPPTNVTVSFNGVPNNGDYSVPVTTGRTNLIGNPYPSALWADEFLKVSNNPDLEGTLYLWTHNTPISPVGNTLQYAGSDYASYNLSGGVGTGNAINNLPPPYSGVGVNRVPTGYIAAGQGFMIKGIGASGFANFKNSMRVPGNNDQFFRSSNLPQTENSIQKHRIWLDIGNTEGAFKEILVGYIEGATNGIDRGFDGDLVDIGNVVTFYTMVDDVKLSIQGKALPFDVNELIPLGYKSTIDGSYTIALSAFDGLFVGQNIYLQDTVTNTIHDLKSGTYTFSTTMGTFEDRFILRFTATTLGTTTPVVDENSVVVYKNEQGLFINSSSENIKNVFIYDIRGRLLASQKQVGNTTTVFTSLPVTQQVLLVKIEGEDGGVVTKKVVY